MTYTALDDRTAKRISDLVGQQTHTKRQRSFSGGKLIGRVSESEQEHARPLLTPDEVLRLPYEDALLLVGGVAAYRGRKIMYYLDSRFTQRAGLVPPDSARRQRGELLPSSGHSDWEPAPDATLARAAAPDAAGSLQKSGSPAGAPSARTLPNRERQADEPGGVAGSPVPPPSGAGAVEPTAGPSRSNPAADPIAGFESYFGEPAAEVATPATTNSAAEPRAEEKWPL
jgi:type IV secretion system protein VirD4